MEVAGPGLEGGQVAILRPYAAVSLSRNAYSILPAYLHGLGERLGIAHRTAGVGPGLSGRSMILERDLCQILVPYFRERRQREVQLLRIPLLGISVNKG